MTVEIWSDVVCPFCYIGMRRFQHALEQFSQKDGVEVIWRSFQLDPELVTDPQRNALQSLADRKGWSDEQAREAVAYVTRMAQAEGLDYRFDRAVVANTFDAHRLTHLAKRHGKQTEAEARLFSAYFSEGKNVADHDVLAEIGAGIGIDPETVRQTLASDAFRDDVDQDIRTARQFGISGVPFFVFDRKYAVSGAQQTDMFLQALERASLQEAE